MINVDVSKLETWVWSMLLLRSKDKIIEVSVFNLSYLKVKFIVKQLRQHIIRVIHLPIRNRLNDIKFVTSFSWLPVVALIGTE